MKIEMIKTSGLKPYEKNPRKNDRAVEAVATSIKTFGFKNPIIADKNLVVIAGHTRLKAAERLNLKTVPVIVAGDLTKEKVAALRLADNKTGELAYWDEDKLAEELKSIDLKGISWQDLGFSDADFEDVEIAGDSVEEQGRGACEVKGGELYALSGHRLLIGDARNARDMARLCGDEKIDLLMTDPPYGVSYTGDWGVPREKTVYDELTGEGLQEFLQAAFSCVDKHLKKGGAFYVWCNPVSAGIFSGALSLWHLSQTLTWV
jgi:site-specific DNA-methyltransferase (adenine-specific)